MDKKGKNKIDYKKMRKVKYVNNNIDRRPYLYLSYNVRLILLFMAVTFLCIMSYLLINKSFASYNTAELDYSENGNVNYNISLIDNDYYSNRNLEGGRQYISSLIDKISADFRYNSFFEDKVVLAYSYNIVGRLYIFSKEGNVLLDEEYPLVDTKEDTIYGNKINLSNKLEIDYQKYNQIAEEYTKRFAPDSTSKLIVRMNINYNGTYQKFVDSNLRHKTYIDMEIPLLKDSFTINIDDSALKETDSYKEITMKTGINTIYSYFGLSCLIIATMLSIRFISLIMVLKPKKSKYCSLRDGYLKDYDRIIVNTKTLPKFTDANIIDCYDFNELLDAQETLELPINYHEIVKNQKCVFFIKNGKEIYKYTLKDCDLEY